MSLLKPFANIYSLDPDQARLIWVQNCLTLTVLISKTFKYPAFFLSRKCYLLITSAAYTMYMYPNALQKHYITEANIMDPDQTAPKNISRTRREMS